jgi:hypothetical protein
MIDDANETASDSSRDHEVPVRLAQSLLNQDGEVVVLLANGCTLRSGVYDPQSDASFISGEYVRLCDPLGIEILFWDQEEWATDPALVMGAIINSAAGLRIESDA